MKYEDYPEEARKAIDRIAERAGVSREKVVAAYVKAAKNGAVNLKSLFLK